MAQTPLKWHRVLSIDELDEGRVTTVAAGAQSIALSRFEGKLCALENACPHQGGPLGEGSIEKGWLRCPWHGWDFHPCTGQSPGSYGDGLTTFEVEERGGEIFVGVPEEAPEARTVTDIMAETMVNWGITHVFGMVGHSNLGLADALRRQVEAGQLHFIGIRHEGAAAFAASAYAKLTGRPAACMGIAGPGSTNMLTGLWDAKVDRAPVLALCGQVNTQVLGPGAFQEVDLASAFGPVSNWQQTVLGDSRHAELVNLALKHAIVERDVSTLIFPDEVQTMSAADDAAAGSPAGRIGAPEILPAPEVMDSALSTLREAKRPVFVVGHGARFHMEEVVRLAEAVNAPVLTTFKGKGLIADSHPLAAGVLGRSGTPVASWFMNECDLMVVFGASFSNHTGITPKKPIIQIDYDRLALGKFHAVDVPVWGEIGRVAREWCAELGACAAEDQRGELAERWQIWRHEKLRRTQEDRGRGVASAAIFEALQRHCPADAVIAVDVGNNTYSFGRYFECERQSVLMSGYLGSIGFGYPAAMGAWAAVPERTIVAVSGDGGFGQYMGELTTAVKYQMPIKHLLINNGELGKISKEQKAGRWPVWETSLHNPNFAQYAELCGAFGRRVERASELNAALEALFTCEGPGMVEVMGDSDLI
jgi:pyruvate oxidase